MSLSFETLVARYRYHGVGIINGPNKLPKQRVAEASLLFKPYYLRNPLFVANKIRFECKFHLLLFTVTKSDIKFQSDLQLRPLANARPFSKFLSPCLVNCKVRGSAFDSGQISLLSYHEGTW